MATLEPHAPHLWVKVVERLLALGEEDQALTKVLYPAMDLAEMEAEEFSAGVAPWYYWRVASLHRKRGERDLELEVLRRFSRQPHANGKRTRDLLARLSRMERREAA